MQRSPGKVVAVRDICDPASLNVLRHTCLISLWVDIAERTIPCCIEDTKDTQDSRQYGTRVLCPEEW